MEPFTHLTAIAAPLPIANIDTDAILPARYLKTIRRSGLGQAAFYTMRFEDGGGERPGFILNRTGYRDARILIAGANFGCGSSREHAPWALQDRGIRCIIAPSFADIFFHNCFKNGILCIVLPQERIDHLTAVATIAPQDFVVDLAATTVTAPDGTVTAFTLDPTKMTNLLLGLDEIETTLRHTREIRNFESEQKHQSPWGERVIRIA